MRPEQFWKGLPSSVTALMLGKLKETFLDPAFNLGQKLKQAYSSDMLNPQSSIDLEARLCARGLCTLSTCQKKLAT